jgi:hypothetical protein
MDHPGRVRARQPASDPRREPGQPRLTERRLAGDQLRQRRALDQLEQQQRGPLDLGHAVHRDDVRIADPSQQRRLLGEALRRPAVLPVRVVQPLAREHPPVRGRHAQHRRHRTAAERRAEAQISRVNPDGTVEELRWIDGADAEVELDAPKGMAIVGEVLYVADITEVRKFDRVTGAPVGSIPIPGAMFLNDLVASPIGRIYVSDTYTNSLHFIDGDIVTPMLMTPELDGPNGLLFSGDFLTVVGFNGPDMFNVPFEGPNAGVVYTFEFGMLDGIVAVPGGILVSTWDAASPGVFLLSNDFSEITPVVEGIDSPADIEVDLDRNMLLVPVLLQNRAEFYPL